MPEEFDLGTLDEARILPARNRREAKRLGRQAFERGQTAGTTTVVGGRNNSYKPRLTRAFNTGYNDRQAEDYMLTPDQVQISRMRNGDDQAFYDFQRKKNNRAAAQVGGGIGATAAFVLGAGTLLPYITGAATVPAWMATAGNEVAQSAGAFFNHPLTRFYFSKPVQGAQFALEATPVATKWAQTGERPSNATLGGLAFHAAALPFMGPVRDFTRGVDLINKATRAAFVGADGNLYSSIIPFPGAANRLDILNDRINAELGWPEPTDDWWNRPPHSVFYKDYKYKGAPINDLSDENVGLLEAIFGKNYEPIRKIYPSMKK